MLPRRAFWVTILDAVLIVSASSALVIALGGRARLATGNLQISLRSPVNALALAAVCGVLRLIVGGWLRPLPSLPIPDMTAVIAERDRFAAWTGASRRDCGVERLSASRGGRVARRACPSTPPDPQY